MLRKCMKMLACTAMTLVISSSTILAAELISLNLFYDGKMQPYTAQEVQVTLDGVKISTGDMPPVIIEGRTLVPVRALTEAMGAEVAWNADIKEAYITKESNVVALQLENKTGHKNGQPFIMDVPPKAINDRTMIPVRAFSESFNCQVTWQEDSRTVVISTSNNPVPETPIAPPVTPAPPVAPAPPPPIAPPVAPPPTAPAVPSSATISITAINIPADDPNSQQGFLIQGSDVINKFEEVKLDDKRIVIDIYNAQKALSQDNMGITNHAYVSGIRTAQHDTNGQPLTRLVFDMKTAADYSISKTADQKAIQLTFQKNKITGINIANSEGADIVTISGEAAISASIVQQQSPRQLVLEIPSCQTYDLGNPAIGNAAFITGATVAMSGESTVQLLLPVNAMVEYSQSQNGNQLILKVVKSTLNGMAYDSATHTLSLEKSVAMDVAAIVHQDNYLAGNYQITLPGNFSAAYGQGTYQIEDDALKNVQLTSADNGNTVLQFNTNKLQAFTFSYDDKNYYIQAKPPREVYDKVLVLDAGHGLQDPGTSGNGLVEKNLNLQVATKVYEKMLTEKGIKTYITRLDDSYPVNMSRATMANDAGDLFVSIHMNSVAGSALTNGTELLYTPHANETADKLSSQIVATVLQQKLITALGTTSRGIKNRPDLLVLNKTTVPAVIAEIVFISNPGDALKISSPEGQDKAAQAIYEGIIELMNNYKLR